jgi:predicted transposase YbfD/YdcC
VDGATLGLAGAAQVIRLDLKVDYLRRGHITKTTQETSYEVTSLYPDQAPPDTLLELIRGGWAIETKQHFRRDRTQREDHCQVRHPTAARNLSLMRSLAIFLFERQRHQRGGSQSLPDWQSRNARHPNLLIAQFLND